MSEFEEMTNRLDALTVAREAAAHALHEIDAEIAVLRSRLRRVEGHRPRTDLTPESLRADLAQCATELEEAISAPDVQRRNRKAIELHSKLVRVEKDMDDVEADGHDTADLRELFGALTDRLLREVFKIDPDLVREEI